MRFKRTPFTGPGSIWIGGRVPTRTPLGTPDSAPAEAVIWLDATHDRILAARVVPAAEADAAFVALLRQALVSPRGALPVHVRVGSEADAVRVRAVLLSAVLEVGPMPEIARIAPLLTAPNGLDDEHDGTFLHDGVLVPGEMARYFAHMAALWHAAPWRFFGESQALELDVPAMGIRGACVSLLGESGDMCGAVVFDSLGDFDKFRASSAFVSPSEDCECSPTGVDSLGLIFRRGAELPDEMRFEVAQYEWVVANANAYPLLLPVGADGHLVAATPRDLQRGCVVSAALAELVRVHSPSLLAADGDADDCLTCVSLECPGRVEAMLWCPHECSRPDVLGRRPRSRVGAGREHAEADRWLEAFHDSANVRWRAQAWRGTAVFMIAMLHDFRLDILGMPLAGLKVWHLWEFLLDYVPRDVLADADMVRDTPEVVDAYLEWLGEAGHESALTMAQLRTLARRWHREFLRKALNPRAFSPGKKFLLSAQAAGVDLEDFAAVAAHHERFERVSQRVLEGIEPRAARPSRRAPHAPSPRPSARA